MDEDSYDELDLQMSEAWPRVIHAELLDRLAAAGARVVAFDVLFAGPSDDPAGDEGLAESLGGLPTVIGVQMDNPTGTEPGTSNQLILPYEPFQKQAKLALAHLSLFEHFRRLKCLNLKRAVSRSKAAHIAELTSNLAILGLTVSVILDCDPKSLNSL
jgi:CHASE2 domain-containing sensor protein